MLTPGEAHERGSDARRIREALAAMGAEGLCGALGLLDGAPGHGPHRAWWRKSDGVMIQCPAHNDRNPSCSVANRDGDIKWHCHGCKAGGGPLDLVAAVQGIDARTAFRPPLDENAKRAFRELLDTGARVAGVPDTRGTYTPRAAPPRAAPRPTEPRAEPLDVDVFARLADVILTDPLTALDRHPEPTDERECCACGCSDVRRYLEDRGILHLAMRDGWRSLPTYADERAQLARNVVAKVGREAWERSGLVLSWHDRDGALRVQASEFKRVHHRVMIPWRDRTGRVTALQRRLLLAIEDPKAWPHRRLITSPSDERIPTEARRIVGRGKYDNAGEVVDPYGAHRLDAEVGAVVFVEGAADALAREEIHRRAFFEMNEAPTPLVALAIGSTGAWGTRAASAWAELARDRAAVVGLDDDEKAETRENTDALCDRMAEDLALVAASVDVSLPQLNGERVKDWGEVLEALPR